MYRRRVLLTSFLFVALLMNNLSLSQTLHHEMQCSQGGTAVVQNNFIVRYSIGQQSVIGTSNSGIVVQQGFNQSLLGKVNYNSNISIETVLFPNPFTDVVNVNFSETPGEFVDVFVFDLLGRSVFFDTIKNQNNTISINLKELPTAQYVVNLSTKNYYKSIKIIKK